MGPKYWGYSNIYVKLHKLVLCLLGPWDIGSLENGAVQNISIKTALYLLIWDNRKVSIHFVVPCYVLRILLAALLIEFCLILLIIMWHSLLYTFCRKRNQIVETKWHAQGLNGFIQSEDSLILKPCSLLLCYCTILLNLFINSSHFYWQFTILYANKQE